MKKLIILLLLSCAVISCSGPNRKKLCVSLTAIECVGKAKWIKDEIVFPKPQETADFILCMMGIKECLEK